MDGGNFSPNSNLFGNFPDSAMDLDFMDELLLDGCWLEATSEPFDGLPLNSDCTAANPNINPIPHQQPSVFPKIEELTENHVQNGKGLGQDQSSNIDQTRSFRVEGDESNQRLWIGPRSNLGPSSSVAERLFRALSHLGEFIKEGGALIQIWVPVKQGSRQVLTTDEQPFLHPKCKSLESYRNVSKSYQFSADEGSKDFLGLPGRVFLGKSPEWTPDVRFFRSDEYPRVNHAQQCDVHGSVALPVFERESGACLGVVEIVTMRQKINYRFDLERVRKALEAVDLRSSENFTPPCAKGCYAHNASPNITEVLESICKSHNLPLALTWAPCLKEDSKASEKFVHCFLIVDSAYYVSDQSLLGFVDACTEHQILHEQGIVGKAFTTGNQYFAVDISAFSKSKFPLSHHARLFNLRAAVAIPLRNIKTGSVEFVLEFFLPRDCQDAEEQRHMLSSLSVVAQQSCQNLNFSIGTELEEITLDSDNSSPLKAASPEQSSSWVAQIMEAQKKDKAVSVPWEYQEEVNKEFKMTQWVDDVKDDLYSKQGYGEFGVQFGQNPELKASDENGGVSSSSGVRRRKVGEKRRTKAEKTISLEVLRQYFAGSLKDAAKNIGVCPTTLKRICRQHGITRWPSRKIKKVGHSLRKLQLVIDSVQGTEGSIQIGSFYTSFPELSSPNLSNNSPFSSTNKMTDHPQPSNAHPENGTVVRSPSSSCSQSSGSSIGNTATNENVQTVQDPCAVLKRACSDAELNQEEEPKVLSRSQSQRTLLGEKNANLESLPPLPKCRNSNNNNNYYYNSRDGGHCGHFRVKANFGGEKVRFSLQPNCGFADLQQEIMKRFNIDDVSKIDLKYLDDDQEWVLLTCDADLDECLDIYKSTQSRTIKISLHLASQLKLGKKLVT